MTFLRTWASAFVAKMLAYEPSQEMKQKGNVVDLMLKLSSQRPMANLTRKGIVLRNQVIVRAVVGMTCEQRWVVEAKMTMNSVT